MVYLRVYNGGIYPGGVPQCVQRWVYPGVYLSVYNGGYTRVYLSLRHNEARSILSLRHNEARSILFSLG